MCDFVVFIRSIILWNFPLLKSKVLLHTFLLKNLWRQTHTIYKWNPSFRWTSAFKVEKPPVDFFSKHCKYWCTVHWCRNCSTLVVSRTRSSLVGCWRPRRLSIQDSSKTWLSFQCGDVLVAQAAAAAHTQHPASYQHSNTTGPPAASHPVNGTYYNCWNSGSKVNRFKRCEVQ